MKHRLTALLTAILLAVTLFVPAAATVRAEADKADAPNPLRELFDAVPAAAFDEGFLSYADYDAVLAANGITERIDPNDDPKAFLDSPAGSAFVNAMLGVQTGGDGFRRFFFKADEQKAKSGVNSLAVGQSLEAGRPPNQQFWLQGGINTADVEKALKEAGYEARQPLAGGTLWCAGGDCSKGHEMDVSKSDHGFIFGGDLGRRWPVVIAEGRLASSPSEPIINAIAGGSGKKLTDRREIASILDAIDAVAARDEGGRLGQLLLIRQDEMFSTPDRGKGLEAIGLFQIDSSAAQLVGFVLHYRTAADAEANAAALTTALPETVTKTGKALEKLINEKDGVIEKPVVEKNDDGTAVMLLTVRFPSLASREEKTWLSNFSLFGQLIVMRDIDWLSPEDGGVKAPRFP